MNTLNLVVIIAIAVSKRHIYVFVPSDSGNIFIHVYSIFNTFIFKILN